MRHNVKAQLRQDVRVDGGVRQLLRDVQQRYGYASKEGRRAQRILACGQRVMAAHELDRFLRIMQGA